MNNNQSKSRNDPHIYDVLIIGAGISGLGAGMRLLKDDFKNFVILEKASGVGGTWRDNTYPGCECDVPSALYSYSFAQNPTWSKTFAGQAEILRYVQDTADQQGVADYVRFNHPVDRAQWIEDKNHWLVTTPSQTFVSRTLVTCSGYLHEPIIPAIAGLDNFSGKIFHSSRWDHQHDLSGERVAVIGTGASAIQFVPKIQGQVKHLSIFQRTPQWVLPKMNSRISPFQQKAFSWRVLLTAWRKILYGSFESFGVGFRHPALLKQLHRLGMKNLRSAIKDPELVAKLTPDYTIGCKRVLMSNHYYRALAKDNVSLHAAGVKAVEGKTVIGSDGSRAEVDTIILGTGFFVTEPPIAAHVFDAEGRSLADRWQDRMQAYKGTTIAGLPNAFMVLGPNLGIGHNSAFVVIEAQLDYIMSTLNTMRRKKLSRVEVRADAQTSYNTKVQRDLQSTVWNTGGCASYYLDKHGVNSVGFPWSTLKMRALLRQFDEKNYLIEQQAALAVGNAA